MSFKLRRRPATGPYWVAIITPPHGRRFERSTKQTRKSVAADVARQWDEEAATTRHLVTLEQALELYRTHKADEKEASEATLEIFELKAAHLLGYFGRSRDVDTIRLAHTVAYLMKRREDGVSDQTAELELRELRGALRHLVRHELYHRDPSAIWPSSEMRPRKKKRRWLPHPEYEALHRVLGEPTSYYREQRYGDGAHGGKRKRRQLIVHDARLGADWRDHLTTYCYAGLRLSELYRLEGVHVRRDDHLDVPGTKTEGAARTIPLHPVLLDVLRRRKRKHKRGPLFPITCASMDAQERAWLRALRKACERAELEHTSTNDLRRTFCSWGFQAGVSEGLMINWMGHHSSRMVREVYAQPSSEQGRAAIALLPGSGNPPRILHTQGSKRANRRKPPREKDQ